MADSISVLVVDDEKPLVKGIKFNLENEGYEVDACYDGEAGLEMARAGDYDLILRLFKDKENALVYVDKYFVKMREGGLSTSGMKSYITLLKECYVVAKRNGLALPLVLTGIRIMRTISTISPIVISLTFTTTIHVRSS